MKRIYAIFDNKAGEVVGNLLTFPHDAPAIRLFGDILSDPQTLPGRHPDDFDLLCLGYISEPCQLVGDDHIVLTGVKWSAAQAPQLVKEA